VLENIGIDKIKFVGYAFQIEMKYRTFVKIYIVEVPIILQTEPKENLK
jgi:dolichol-phosphate mannosyltransferase